MIAKLAFVLVPAVLAAGCGYRPAEVADPNEISLKKALFDVVDSLDETRERTKDRKKIGLIVDEATVVFNLSASATSDDSLKVDTALPATAAFPLSASWQSSLQNVGQRGNQITIKFKSIATGKVSPSALEIIERCNRPKPPAYCRALKVVPPA